ncbi:MAG: hypothetical protein O2807_07035, partial [bacterium]|nr:hypothetical protein [bacterium]
TRSELWAIDAESGQGPRLPHNSGEKIEEAIEKENLAGQLNLYREVKEFYTNDPDARYFRGSDYTSGDDE